MQSDKVPRTRHGLSCVSEKPSISARPILAARKAAELAAVFETLANDTRLKVLNVMVQGTETSPTELAEKIGMKAQAISNQLKRLCDREIIVRRREGNQVYYRIVDPLCNRFVGTRAMAYSRHQDSKKSQKATPHCTK
jgi:DNA-binding transcriptional ArsR family regulator